MSLFNFGPLVGVGLFCGSVLEAQECHGLFKDIENPPSIDGFGEFTSVIGASEAFFRQLKGTSLDGCRITVFPSPAGRMLLAVVAQLGECQSRLLFDLDSPRTRQMLQQAKTTEQIRLLFFLDGGCEALVCGLGISAEVVEDLLALPSENGRELSREEVLADSCFVAIHLLKERDELLVAGKAIPVEITVTETITNEVLKGAEGGKSLK